MTLRAPKYAVLVLLAAAHIASPRDAAAQTDAAPDPGMTDVARDLFEDGVAAANAGDWKTCRVKQSAALKLKVHWQIAINLAECEAELGLHRDAAEHISLALRELPAEETARRANAEALLARVKPFVAEVTVTVEGGAADGATLSIDGAPVGQAPIAFPLYLQPGLHTIQARSEDGAVQSTEVQATAGGAHPVSLVLGTGTAGGGGPPDGTTPGGGDSFHPHPVLIAGGAVLAVAALVTGSALHIAASGNDSDVDDLAGEVSAGGGTCTPVTGGFEAQCATIADAQDSASSQRAIGTPMLVGGAIVGTLVLGYALLWPADSPATTGAAIELIPSVSPDFGGALFRGRF